MVDADIASSGNAFPGCGFDLDINAESPPADIDVKSGIYPGPLMIRVPMEVEFPYEFLLAGVVLDRHLLSSKRTGDLPG